MWAVTTTLETLKKNTIFLTNHTPYNIFLDLKSGLARGSCNYHYILESILANKSMAWSGWGNYNYFITIYIPRPGYIVSIDQVYI